MVVLRGALVALLLAAVLATPTLAAEDQEQWGLERVRAPEAWQQSRGEGVVIAVVDTGVDHTHPDLAPRLLRDTDGRVVGRDFVDGDRDARDGHGHGTLVAGIAAAAADAGLSGTGIAGIAPRSRIMPVRVLDDEGRGRFQDLDAGIRWAVDNGADVVNLSLESAVPVPGEVLTTGPDEAVRYAWERGVPVVAATGNSGTPFTDYRSSTPVLLVGASDRDDRRAAFSDSGRSDMVFAPGVDILSTSCDPCGDRPRHGYATGSGTSFAAPHAAGATALLLGRGVHHERAVERLRTTAVDLEGGGMVSSSGHGRIDAAAALGVDEAEERRKAQASDADADGGGGATDGSSEHQTSNDTGRERSEPPAAGADEGEQPSDTSSADDRASGSDPRDEREQDADLANETDDADEGEDPDGRDTAEDTPGDAGQAQDADAPRDGARTAVDPVEVPAGPDAAARIGLPEGLAAGLVLGSAAAVARVRRRLGGF